MKIIENRKKYIALSLVIMLAGACVMIFNAVSGNGAFNYDVEFSGGTSVQMEIGQDFDNDEIQEIITQITGQSSPQVQKVLGTTQVTFKISSVDQETRIELVDAIQKKYELDENAVLNMSDISATISQEMQRAAVLAVVIACAVMLVYISARFRDVKTGGSAILALIHDVIMVIIFYGVFRIPLNYSFIAVVLTILGYSINATIVIFDRIRENKILKNQTNAELVDKSVNQTLRRSLFTSFTTFLTITCVYIWGVPSIKNFSLPIMIGIIAGTYSSVFLSGTFWYMMTKKA